jgi:hypothetical protein
VVVVIVASTIQDCATAAGVLRIVLEAEERAAEREIEPEPEPVVPHASTNGHGHDAALERGTTVASNGATDVPAPGVAFGAPMQITERRIELREGDQ